MAWGRNDQYETLRMAIRAELPPLMRAEVQPIRNEIDQLRAEVQQGFAAADNKYLLVKIADLRYGELAQQIAAIEKNLAGAGASNMNRWFRLSIGAGLLLSVISLLISLWSNVLIHLAYHP